MNQMNIELSKMQLIHLSKKGWGGYSKPSDDLEEMENGVVLLHLWQVPMGMDILLPVLTVCMILWNKL